MSARYDNILDINISDGEWLATAGGHLPGPMLKDKVVKDLQSARILTAYNAGCIGMAIPILMRLQLYPGISTPNIKIIRNEFTLPTTATFLTLPGDSPIHLDHYMFVDTTPPAYLMVGLARTSKHFSAMPWVKAFNGVKIYGNTFSPVKQLACLCQTANVRYGYVQTSEELSVWCFSPAHGGIANTMTARFTVIPFSVHGEQDMKTEKALFWLCMLSLGLPAQRGIVPQMHNLAAVVDGNQG